MVLTVLYIDLVEKFSVGSYSRGTHKRADGASHLFSSRDFAHLELKPDHADRPLWIDPENGRIIVESFSQTYNRDAEIFLVAIAEPQSRVSRIHEYTLTSHS